MARLAEKGGATGFSNCIAHGKWTGTSSASILTGTTPPTHRIYGSNNRALSAAITTVPELLPDEYSSLSVLSNPNAGPARNLDRGFDETRYVFPSRLTDAVEYRTLAKSLLQLWSHGGGLSFNIQRQKGLSSYMMGDIAKRFVRNQDGSFFLYMHPNSTHHPYMPPRSLVDRYLEKLPVTPEEALEISESAFSDVHELIAEGGLSGTELDAVTALYDACLSHIDRWVGDLVEAIISHDDDTIIVITADHGDLLGEYGLFSHKFVLHDALVHVPLVTVGLDGVAKQADNVVQHIDVVKTVLAQLGQSSDQLAGNDLCKDDRQYAVSQRHGTNARKNLEKVREYNPEFTLPRDHPDMLTGVRSTAMKLLHTDRPVELFSLPDESTDVGDEFPTQRDEMAAFAENWLQDHASNRERNHTHQLDDDIESHLLDMGYIT